MGNPSTATFLISVPTTFKSSAVIAEKVVVKRTATAEIKKNRIWSFTEERHSLGVRRQVRQSQSGGPNVRAASETRMKLKTLGEIKTADARIRENLPALNIGK